MLTALTSQILVSCHLQHLFFQDKHTGGRVWPTAYTILNLCALYNGPYSTMTSYVRRVVKSVRYLEYPHGGMCKTATELWKRTAKSDSSWESIKIIMLSDLVCIGFKEVTKTYDFTLAYHHTISYIYILCLYQYLEPFLIYLHYSPSKHQQPTCQLLNRQ